MLKLKFVFFGLLICSGIVSVNGFVQNEADSILEDAKSYFFEGDFNNSLELIDVYISQYPMNASAWNLRGMVYLQNGSYKKAEESFLKAVTITPNDSRIYYNLGLTSFNRADLVQAEKYFNNSISHDFETPEQFFYLGLSQYGLTHYGDAIQSFNRSIELNPKDPAVWLNLGTTYERIKRLDKAILAYNEANILDPTYAKPYFLKGKIFMDYGNSTNAMLSFRNYTRLEPNDDNGWFWYANSLRKTDHRDESLEALYRAIDLNPENEVYKRYLAIYDYGNYSGIIYDYTINPLPLSYVIGASVLMIVLSLIAFIRRK